MKKIYFFSAKTVLVSLIVIINMTFFSSVIIAQTTDKTKIEKDRTVSDIRDNNILIKNESVSNKSNEVDLSRINNNTKNKGTVNQKEIVVINKNNEKSEKSIGIIELKEKRDSHSKTYLNPDGSYTKVQSYGLMHYKDNGSNWIPLNGNIYKSKTNENIYEINETDLPVTVDVSTGKTTMMLEKNGQIVFGNNVDLVVYDYNFNEISRLASAKSKDSNINENEIKLKNIWNNIDRQQQVDYRYVKTDYVLNQKPLLNIHNGYIAFEDKIELPAGWQIIKAEIGKETQSGWQGDLIILNSEGKEVGRFLLPVYFDNPEINSTENIVCELLKKVDNGAYSLNKQSRNNFITGTYKIKRVNGKYIISVIVQLEWLLAPERSYPVIIDPTATNTYSAGNIASCYYPSFNTVNMNVTIPAGSTVTSTNSQCTYTAVSPSWRSDAWVGFQSGSNIDGYWYCNVNSPGTCNVTGTTNSNIANGTYPTGSVPFTLRLSRDYPSGSCNTTYLYVQNNTWTETVTYTTPCTIPGTPALVTPANNTYTKPGKTIHFEWDAPATGTPPFTYTFYFYNGSAWNNWSAGTNTYFDLQLSEYGSNSWCGTNTQWYVKATNNCGNTNSATRNLFVYPKYSGSTADYTLTPDGNCQTSGAHSISQGQAKYYSFYATAGSKYYFSTCGGDLGCGQNTGWDTYLKIYGTDGSCTLSSYNDDGGVCSNYESFINGWTCSTSGTYYLQVTGYNSSAYGTYHLQYSSCTAPTGITLLSPQNNTNIQPGKVTRFEWQTPSGGTLPVTYTLYLWNGSTWLNFDADTNKYVDLRLSEYNSSSWCGFNAQWYVKATNSCGNTNSATWNFTPYPKYAGSSANFAITPTNNCQTTGVHTLSQGGANYYSFDATAGNTYYFSTYAIDLGCGTNTGWDTYLKIYGTDGSCSTSAYNDDGGSCLNYESYINGWACTATGTYYLQITGYNSLAYGNYYLQYKASCTPLSADLTGGSSPICYNDVPEMFTANGSGGDGTFSYLWYLDGISTGITTQTFTMSAMTNNAEIYCAVSSCGYTVNTNTYNIIVLPLPVAVAGNDTTINFDQSVQIGSTPIAGYTYSWFPAIYLSDSYIANPVAMPSNSISYTMTIIGNNGCSATDFITINVVENPSETTPKGTFDIVFDKNGNRYNLSDIMISGALKDNKSLLLCTSGYFNLYFEQNSGMYGNSQTEIDRRTVICQLFEDISNFINSPLTISGDKVNIWIRDISNIPGVGNPSTSSVLGLATSFYTVPSGAPSFSGIVDNEIWKTINSGVDSYTNISSPLTTQGGQISVSGTFFHGMMAYNFSNPAFNWHSLLTACPSPNYIDEYTIALHELTHALGFASLINGNGESKLGSNFRYYSRYDLFLKDPATNEFLITNTGSCQVYNYQFNPLLNTNILIPIPSNCTNQILYSGSVTQTVYTPSIFAPPSSLSHFEDICHTPNPFPDNSYYVMSDTYNPTVALMKRYLKPEERSVLCDIGYNVNDTYSSPADNANFTYGTGACPGLQVVGINDGIDNTGNYTYVTPNNINMPINNILVNDYNTISFECLEVVIGTGNLSNTSGTTFNYQPTTIGLHLLRYIPVSANNNRGNITYIYVYSLGIDCTPSACNIVNNGGFESAQNCGQMNINTIPPPSIDCWERLSASPDLYVRYCIPSNAPSITVPTPYTNPPSDTPPSNSTNDNMIGIWSREGAWNEALQCNLSSSIVPNTPYILSFWARVENNFTFSQNLPSTIVIAGSQNLLALIGGWYGTTPAQLTTLSTIVVQNNNQWNYYEVTINSNAATNLNFLSVINASYLNTYNPPGHSTNVLIDNIRIEPEPQHVTFQIPSTTFCINQFIDDLNSYMNPNPPNGTFSGPGVSCNLGICSFDPSVAGVGSHTIIYSFTNILGCPQEEPIIIDVINNSLDISLTSSYTDCISSCNGTASVNVITGTSPFSYNWNDPFNQNTPTATNLCQGNFTVTVIDANNCATVGNITLAFANPSNWPFHPSGTVREDGKSIAVDNNGAIYMTGRFSDQITLMNTYTSAGSTDIYIVKLDECGNILWDKQLGGTGDDRSNNLIIDNQGNIIITGYFSNTLGPLASVGEWDIFVIKLDPNGNPIWHYSKGFSINDAGYDVTVDSNDDVYVVGSLDVGSINNSDFEVYVAKLNGTNGVMVWEDFNNPSANADFGYGITYSSDLNQILITGVIDVDPIPSGNAFISIYNTTSNIAVATQTLAFYSAGQDIVTYYDATGPYIFAYVAGTRWNGLQDHDIMLIKANVTGNTINYFLPPTIIGLGDDDFATDLEIDPVNNVLYLTGQFKSQSVTFPPLAPLNNSGSHDNFVAKYDYVLNNFVWNVKSGSTFWEESMGIALNNNGFGYVTGHFMNQAVFGQSTLYATGISGDAFIARIQDLGASGQFAKHSFITNNNVVQESYPFVKEDIVNIYPNPANDEIVIDFHFASEKLTQITITDLHGKEVIQEEKGNFLKEKKIINISNLQPSVYLVKVKTPETMIAKKIIVLR